MTSRNLHPPRVTPMPQTPKDVGCPPACGKYRPNVYACLECLVKATEAD